MQQEIEFNAIVVAAGKGERFGGRPKQLHPFRGRPLLAWPASQLAAAGAKEIVVVASPEIESLARQALGGLPARIVLGGATRTASVRAGLEALDSTAAEAVLVHDAARPLLPLKVIERLLDALRSGLDGAAPALRVADALWREHDEGPVPTSRVGLNRVQTPQAFRLQKLREAYAAQRPEAAFDDDLAVLQSAGGRVALISGDPRLMKLTYAEDFEMLDRLAGGETCVGSGFDAHRFGPGDHIVLCGVRIAHERGVVGHSDADVAWHALVDAILGALGRGDIGEHFPSTDTRWAGAASETFLRHARALVEEAGARIVHVDITVVAERPKLAPHRQAMRARTAEALAIDLDRVSVKATTTERMGFTGREEGLMAQATATLDRLRL